MTRHTIIALIGAWVAICGGFLSFLILLPDWRGGLFTAALCMLAGSLIVRQALKGAEHAKS